MERLVECKTCNGSGRKPVKVLGVRLGSVPCPDCDGTGTKYIFQAQCPVCHVFLAKGQTHCDKHKPMLCVVCQSLLPENNSGLKIGNLFCIEHGQSCENCLSIMRHDFNITTEKCQTCIAEMKREAEKPQPIPCSLKKTDACLKCPQREKQICEYVKEHGKLRHKQ